MSKPERNPKVDAYLDKNVNGVKKSQLCETWF